MAFVFRQHRTEIVVQMRSQILRQIVHKFRRYTARYTLQDASNGAFSGKVRLYAINASYLYIYIRRSL